MNGTFYSPKESSWDDRETEVRWVAMNSDAGEQETNAEMAKKIIEPIKSYLAQRSAFKCYLMPPWHSPSILAALKRSISRTH